MTKKCYAEFTIDSEGKIFFSFLDKELNYMFGIVVEEDRIYTAEEISFDKYLSFSPFTRIDAFSGKLKDIINKIKEQEND